MQIDAEVAVGERFDPVQLSPDDVEDLATRSATKAKAFGPDVGGRNRIALVKQKLRIAIDELDGYPASADDISEE